MLTSVRSLMAASLLVGTAFAATPALAQDEDSSGLSVSGNVAVVTDYRFRGVSQTGGDFAIQGGIDVAHDSGFYVGTWGSSIQGGQPLGEMELDVYAGWTGEVSPGVTFDVGLLYYIYPTGDVAGADTDFFEPYASIGTTLGPVGATVGVAYAWDQSALGDNDNLYVYTDWSLGIPDSPVSLTAHLGYTDGVLAPTLLSQPLLGDDSGFDWSLGASMPVYGGLTLGVAYVGTEGRGVDKFTDDAIVGTLSFAM
jgi:uncharacterized protein (TIGR02001 family)